MTEVIEVTEVTEVTEITEVTEVTKVTEVTEVSEVTADILLNKMSSPELSLNWKNPAYGRQSIA